MKNVHFGQSWCHFYRNNPFKDEVSWILSIQPNELNNWCVLTDAVWDDFEQVLCEQQVGESQEATQLWRKLLQSILRDIQTNQPPKVSQVLNTWKVTFMLTVCNQSPAQSLFYS